jgi:hypothetical protein
VEGEAEGTAGARQRATRAPHVLLAVLVAVLLAVNAIVLATWDAGDDRAEGSPPPTTAPAPIAPPPPTVLFSDDFSGSSAFSGSEEEVITVTVADGQHRTRFHRSADIYSPLPDEVPERAVVEQTRDVSVAIEVRQISGDPGDWFGVICRTGGLDADLYVAAVRADGSWTIYRSTLGSQRGPYVQRALAVGRTPGIAAVQPALFVFRIRLECIGEAPTTLRLFVNDREVGRVDDPVGVPPGNVGFATSSRTGEFVFDNLVVTALG